MKRCPKCNKNYADETLNFCLDDGEWLRDASGSEEPVTAILTSEAPTRVHGAEPLRSSEAVAEKRSFSANMTAKPLMLAGVIGMLLIGGFFGYRYFGPSGKQINSIAVMPFLNQSGSPELEYLSDGMTDTLISSLTQLPELAVKPRSSVFRYKGKDADAKAIGKELNVAAILNGTVVQRGSEMSLHVELIDTATETLLWSANYTRPVANLVALQSEITRDVVDKLKIKLSGADAQKLAKKYTENGEAYRLYLHGRYLWNKQTNKDIEKSIEYFQRAIAIDANYALAYSGLADAYSLNVLGASRARMAKAREAALKALEYDNDLPEAHASLGRILSVDDYDFSGAERELRTAVNLDPNYGTGHHFLAGLLATMGRFEEAFAEHQRALDLEPDSAVFNAGYGSSLMLARRY